MDQRTRPRQVVHLPWRILVTPQTQVMELRKGCISVWVQLQLEHPSGKAQAGLMKLVRVTVYLRA